MRENLTSAEYAAFGVSADCVCTLGGGASLRLKRGGTLVWREWNAFAVARDAMITAIVGGHDLFPGLERSPAAKNGLVLVRCSDSLDEILSFCRRLAPCVLILDLHSLQPPDLEKFRETVNTGLLIKVLVRVDSEDPEVLEPLIRMGCSGFLKSKTTPSAVRRAVFAVEAGEIWASRKVLSRMLKTVLIADRLNLTVREREILDLIGNGFKNHEIASQLFITIETVRWHIRSLYNKIGVRDRLSAAIYARNNLYCAQSTPCSARAQPLIPSNSAAR